MFHPEKWLVWLLVALTGCATAPPKRDSKSPPPSDWREVEEPLAPNYPSAPDIPVRANNPPASIPTNTSVAAVAPSPKVEVRPAPPAPVRLPPESTWISSKRWAEENGLPEPRYVSSTPTMTRAISTTNGEFIFQVGSRIAFWNGMELRLGFAPALVSDQVFLHALDVRKTLETLARGISVSVSSNRLVVIDPGHGGRNTGARSVTDGRYEKEFTLDWALRLEPLLEQRGWRVLLTRTNDVDVTLPDRVAFAEAYQADLFLSLHFNVPGGNSREPSGLETYVLTPTGMPSSIVRDFSDDPEQVFPNNALDAENLRYAVRLHRALLQVNGNNDRGVRHARFPGVLRGQRRPAVLIEGGYLSNPQEAQLIALPAYRQRLAEALAAALD